MPSWPDLAAVELLVAIADHGSLSAGARAVGMEQPNASRSIARLERHLGLVLLQRSTRGSRLTPTGVVVVDWARTVIAAATTLRDGAASLAATGQDSITVAASQTVAEHLLPRWLAALRTRDPGTRVTVHVHNSADVAEDLRGGRCDLGFVEGPVAPRDLHSQVVAHDELVLVVGREHPWVRRRRPVSAAELAGTPLVAREPGSGTRIALERALGTETTPILELPSNAAVRVAVVSGAGPAVLSRLAVAEALDSGVLVSLAVDGVDLHRSLRAIWTGPRRLVGAAADLLDVARHGS